MKSLNLFLLVIALALLSGCATTPPPQSINEKPLTRIASIDKPGLFVADQEGRSLAFAQQGLVLRDLASRQQQKIASDSPVALSWSLDGSSLAAAFSAAEYATRLVVYSAQGQLLHETLLPVALSQMVWSARGDLLVTGFALKRYSFGGDLQQLLFRVNGADVEKTVLAGTTLKLSSVKNFASIMLALQPVAFSPCGDELIYLHLHDPPQFPPTLELFYRNWQVGESRSLQRLSLQTLDLDWDKAESVTVRSAAGGLTLDLWPTEEAVKVEPATVSRYFDNGRLYQEAELLADWGEGTQLQILADGRFLLAAQQTLYLGDGLPPELSTGCTEKDWTLRRWRFDGLITPEEYQKLLRKATP